MSKKIFIALVVVVFLGVAWLLSWSDRSSKYPMISLPIAEPKSNEVKIDSLGIKTDKKVIDPSVWSTFKNPVYAYEVKYNPLWTLHDVGNKAADFLDTISEKNFNKGNENLDEGNKVEIIVDEDKANVSLGSRGWIDKYWAKEQRSDFTQINLNGVTVLRRNDSTSRSTVFSKGNRIYIVNLLSPQGIDDQNDFIYEEMLRSFRID